MLKILLKGIGFLASIAIAIFLAKFVFIILGLIAWATLGFHATLGASGFEQSIVMYETIIFLLACGLILGLIPGLGLYYFSGNKKLAIAIVLIWPVINYFAFQYLQ